ncbi:hypothetical protein N836_22870 [Leptolyngbya sp. Heron Island J]|nr:hypothetical protein N836_22870 [Leptolyngbya sp. Heron Island J]
MAFMLVVRFFTPIPIRHLTRDPLVLAEKPFYFGFLSNVGVLLWCGTAAVCLFSSLLLFVVQGRRESSLFFAVFGSISLWLMLDDLLMIHEVLDEELHLVPDKVTYTVYGLAVVVSLLRFRKLLIRVQPWVLGLSLVFFGISMGFDVLVPQGWAILQDDAYLLEDGAKLLAIFVWAVYFCRVALEQLLGLVKVPISS